MMRGDPVLERLRMADPSPVSSPEPDVVLTEVELRSLVEERIGSMSNDLRIHTPPKDSGTPRRWGVAIASAAAVLVIGLIVAFVGFGTSPDDAVEPATDPASDPAMVDAFIDAWNSGSHDEAIAYMAEDLTVNGEPWTTTEWKSYMEYTEAIGMTVETECAAATLNVSCDIAQLGPFVSQPMEGSAGTIAFSIVDEQISGIVMPRRKTAEDRLADFARQSSPTGYGQACAQAEGAHWHGLFDSTPTTFNTQCGTYIATHTEAFVTAESDVRTIGAYFDAWNAGDIATAERLLASDLMVNSTQADENWASFMQFAIAFDGEHDVACEATVFGSICSWVWHTEFVDAQEIDNVGSTDIRFTVVDGQITSFRTPSYGAFEGPLVAFARTADPDALELSCAGDGVAIIGTTGIVFNRPCGEFLASHVDAFIADLDA